MGGDKVKVCAKYGKSALKTFSFWAVKKLQPCQHKKTVRFLGSFKNFTLVVRTDTSNTRCPQIGDLRGHKNL
jgi:hypothetical protein